MVQSKDDFIAGMKRDIARWKVELSEVQDYPDIVATVRKWIDAGEKLIAELER